MIWRTRGYGYFSWDPFAQWAGIDLRVSGFNVFHIFGNEVKLILVHEANFLEFWEPMGWLQGCFIWFARLRKTDQDFIDWRGPKWKLNSRFIFEWTSQSVAMGETVGACSKIWTPFVDTVRWLCWMSPLSSGRSQLLNRVHMVSYPKVRFFTWLRYYSMICTRYFCFCFLEAFISRHF